MRPVTFSNYADELLVELGCLVLAMLAMESYQAGTDVEDLLLAVAILRDLYLQLPVPLLTDMDIK